VNDDEGVSVLAKKTPRPEAYDYVCRHMSGIAEGKTLLIGFFSRGPIGAPAAIPALEITTSTYVDIPAIVRQVIKEIGYSNSSMGFDWETCAVVNSIDKQSADISQGVSAAAKKVLTSSTRRGRYRD